MKNKTIHALAAVLERMFAYAGIRTIFRRITPEKDFTLVNKNYLEIFYKKSSYVDIYNEAMKKANSSSRDSFEKQIRYYGLYQMVLHVLDKSIPGDFVECGCWRGHSAYLIAKLIEREGLGREMHIFDSFEGGLSEKSIEDKALLATVNQQEMKVEKEAFFSTEAEVASTLSSFNFVTLYKGWVPTQYQSVERHKFALVYLDLDLYQPIEDSLSFFYPRLSDGGVIIVDDYGTTDWPGVKIATDKYLSENPPRFALETMGSIIIVK